MRRNLFDDDKAKIIGNTISRLIHLKTLRLDFYDNKITKIGAWYIINSITNLRNLEKLFINFEKNEFGWKTVQKLEKELDKHLGLGVEVIIHF